MTQVVNRPETLKHVLLETQHQNTGYFDAVKIAQTLHLSLEDMAKAVGMTARALRGNPTSAKAQAPLTRIVAIVQRTREMFVGSLENALIWLRAPNPELGYRTPMSCIIAGNFLAVEMVLDGIEWCIPE
jgi:uncharacterized protein (DUF2384 family)